MLSASLNKTFPSFPCTNVSISDCEESALKAFLNVVRVSSRQEEVQFVEFEEYYEGLSIGVAPDQDFANILRNTWTI